VGAATADEVSPVVAGAAVALRPSQLEMGVVLHVHVRLTMAPQMGLLVHTIQKDVADVGLAVALIVVDVGWPKRYMCQRAVAQHLVSLLGLLLWPMAWHEGSVFQLIVTRTRFLGYPTARLVNWKLEWTT
jgi:hypothetical protein